MSRRILLPAAILALAPMCGGQASNDDRGGQVVCESGRQVVCACPGGGFGQGACKPDGSGPLACECEDAPPAAGSSSDATTGPAGGFGGGGSSWGDGGVTSAVAGEGSMEAGVGGSDGGSEDGGSGGAVGEADQSCPTEAMLANCSDTCDQQRSCTVMRCNGGDPLARIDIPSFGEGEVVFVRTPARPGDQDCEQCNGGDSSVANITLQATSFDAVLMYQVDPPWYVVPVNTTTQAPRLCRGVQCLTRSASLAVGVGTTDPNAPARNVRISVAPVRGCLDQ